MYFSKNPKSLMTNDLRDLRDHFLVKSLVVSIIICTFVN